MGPPYLEPGIRVREVRLLAWSAQHKTVTVRAGKPFHKLASEFKAWSYSLIFLIPLQGI